MPLAFALLGAIRAAPFLDDVPLDVPSGDDWLVYKVRAHSVLVDGLTMPIVAGPYGGFHGFLYIYFLAAIFRLFGENTAFVYVIQAALLGVAAILFFLLARPWLTLPWQLVVFAAIVLELYVDVFRAISFRLLSENLALPLVAGGLLLYTRGRSFAAGLDLGLLLLARPTFTAAVTWLGIVRAAKAVVDRRLLAPVAFAIGIALGVVWLPLRDWFAVGRPGSALFSDTRLWTIASGSGELVSRILFVLGVTTPASAEYRWRPHWIALWILVAAAVWIRRRHLDWIDAALAGAIASYAVSNVLVGDPANYGGRAVAVLMPLLIVTASRATSPPRGGPATTALASARRPEGRSAEPSRPAA